MAKQQLDPGRPVWWVQCVDLEWESLLDALTEAETAGYEVRWVKRYGGAQFIVIARRRP